MTPTIIPWKILFEKSYSGTTIINPMKTIIEIKIFLLRIFFLSKMGSRIVVKIGKDEKLSNPIATDEIWIERKNVDQLIASKNPSHTNLILSFNLRNEKLRFLNNKKMAITIAASNILEKTMKKADSEINFPKIPESPIRKIETWTSIFPQVELFKIWWFGKKANWY